MNKTSVKILLIISIIIALLSMTSCAELKAHIAKFNTNKMSIVNGGQPTTCNNEEMLSQKTIINGIAPTRDVSKQEMLTSQISHEVSSNIAVSNNELDDNANAIASTIKQDNDKKANTDIINDNSEFSNNEKSTHSNQTNTSSSNNQTQTKNQGDNSSSVSANHTTELPNYKTSPEDQELLLLINNYRMTNGSSELTLDADLCKLAYVRAQEIATYWSHTRPNGESPYSVFEEYGVAKKTCVGENLADFKILNLDNIVQAWANSDGHNKTMLHKQFRSIGIAIFECGGRYYIVNIFNG